MSHPIRHGADHALKGAAEIVQELAPLPTHKNPVIAFVAGFVGGAVGVGLYLRSLKDFAVCLGLFLVLSFFLPGLGSVLGWVFAAVYGAFRAHTSNVNGGF